MKHSPLLIILFCLPIIFLHQSCSQKTARTDTGSFDDLKSGYMTQVPDRSAMTAPTRDYAMVQDPIKQDVYFQFDSSRLTTMARDNLQQKAQWLKDNPSTVVVIEGHCDKRGTTEYNLALGDRRANSARSFLIQMGISPSRMIPLSYGEEQATGYNEQTWAMDRRAHFVMK